MSPQCSSCQKPKAAISRSTIYSVSDYGDSDEKHNARSHRSSRCHHSHDDDDTSYRSIPECNYEQRQFYKPRPIRNWVLAIFLVAIILAVVLLELAVAAHPSSSQVLGVRKRDVQFEQPHVIQIRQESESITSDGKYENLYIPIIQLTGVQQQPQHPKPPRPPPSLPVSRRHPSS